MLPNSRNVLMAAEEAARLAAKDGREVVVVAVRRPSRRALAALVEFDPADDARARTPSGSRPGSATIRVGAVAPAARDDAEGRFRRGDSVGFAGGEIVAWGGAGSTLIETVAALADGRRDRHRDRGRRGADRRSPSCELELPDGAELELQRGGTAELLLADRRAVTRSARR